MIYTVTLNPSLDYIMHLDGMNINSVNRSLKEEVYPGGKGVNVSIVLNNLRVPNKALGFIAGFTGKEIERVMTNLGSNCDFITLDQGISRINVKLEAGKETEINGMGPQITPADLKELFAKLDEIQEGDFLVLAGSIPNSVPDSIYQDIMKELAHKNIHVVVDATKDLLKNVLKYKPFLIKPNHIELAEMFNVEINSDEEIVTYARKLQEMGAQNVLISMGGDGSILITSAGEVVKISVPKGTVINTGSATAFSPWLATADKVDDLLSQL